MKSQAISLRRQIGSALWLLEVLVNLAPQAWDGKSRFFVAGAQVLSDRQLGMWLDAKASTIAGWRRKLKAAGLLDWTVKPGLGRLFMVEPATGWNFFKSEESRQLSEASHSEPESRNLRAG